MKMKRLTRPESYGVTRQLILVGSNSFSSQAVSELGRTACSLDQKWLPAPHFGAMLFFPSLSQHVAVSCFFSYFNCLAKGKYASCTNHHTPKHFLLYAHSLTLFCFCFIMRTFANFDFLFALQGFCRSCGKRLKINYIRARKYYHPKCHPPSTSTSTETLSSTSSADHAISTSTINSFSASSSTSTSTSSTSHLSSKVSSLSSSILIPEQLAVVMGSLLLLFFSFDLSPSVPCVFFKNFCRSCKARLSSARVRHYDYYCLNCKKERIGCSAHSLPSASASSSSSPSSCSSSFSSSNKRGRPATLYSLSSPTTKKRRKSEVNSAIHTAAKTIDFPLSNIQLKRPSILVSEFILLPCCTRTLVRSTITSVSLPCERTIRKKLKTMAFEQGTETIDFTIGEMNGSFISDPLLFIETVMKNGNELKALGGDKGGGITKLGLTYSDSSHHSHFVSLLVYDGKDDYQALSSLNHPSISFTGRSTALVNFSSLLQFIIDRFHVCLNGDWLFINSILGLKSASSTHPCFICDVNRVDLLSSSYKYRTNYNINSSLSIISNSLITINPLFIVPIPLHLLLGIGNRIVKLVFIPFLGSKFISTLSKFKSVHTPSHAGAAAVFDLNGNELYNLLNSKEFKELIITHENGEERNKLWVGWHWVSNLFSMLEKKEWLEIDRSEWQLFVQQIHQLWQYITNKKPIPKLHMLLHVLPFVEKFRSICPFSESQIESSHNAFNRLMATHRNSSHHPSERLRRAHANSIVAPIIL